MINWYEEISRENANRIKKILKNKIFIKNCVHKKIIN